MWGEGNIDRRRRGRPIPKLKLRGGCGVASIKERGGARQSKYHK